MIRAELAVATDRDVNDSRVDRTAMAVANSPFVERARAEVLHDHVGDRGELEKDLATLVAAKVERETALVAVDGGVQEADFALFTRDPGRDLAADFAVGCLDLDNVGA